MLFESDEAVLQHDAVVLSQEDLHTAIEIAHHIADEAVWSDGVCAFHGATAPHQIGQPAIYRSFGGDLYEGSAGIARFLGLAAHLTDDEKLRRTALGGMAHAIARSEGWSLFSGRAGVGLVTLELARWLNIPAFVAKGIEVLELASEEALYAKDGPFDFLAGTAGVVHALYEANNYDLDGRWRARAAALGHALITSARQTETGWSWPMMSAIPDHLCGLAHGGAGIALAFSELENLCPDEKCIWAEAAAHAHAFERQWFSPIHSSWADLRSDAGGSNRSEFAYPHFWCHGSVGIGQARVAVLALGLDDPLTRAEALAALVGARTAAERIVNGRAGPSAGFDVNGSQCHGVSGMIDFFIDAWRLDPDPILIKLCRSLTAFMRNDAGQEKYWRCGVVGGEFTPGLMLGLAGIGWAHLRAWNPSLVPSAYTPRLVQTIPLGFVQR